MTPFKSLPLPFFIITIFLVIYTSSLIPPAVVIRKRINDSTAVNVSKFVVEQYMYNSQHTPHHEDQWVPIVNFQDPTVVENAKFAVAASNLELSFLEIQQGSLLWTVEIYFLKLDIKVLEQPPRLGIESTYRAEMNVANGFQQLTKFVKLNGDHQNSANHLDPEWTPIPGCSTNPNAVGYAKFAVDKYNEQYCRTLLFTKINSGSTRMSNDGSLYVRLNINVKETRGTTQRVNYIVKLYCSGGPGGEKHLTSFTNDAQEGSNWVQITIPRNPDFAEYAKFAVTEYNRLHNKHLVFTSVYGGLTRMDNVLFQVKLDIYVKYLEKGAHFREMYRVQLHCTGNSEKHLDEFNPLE